MNTFACSNDCGRAALPGHDLCAKCDEAVLGEDEPREERGFEGKGDFYSDDPVERWVAHQASKGRL